MSKTLEDLVQAVNDLEHMVANIRRARLAALRQQVLDDPDLESDQRAILVEWLDMYNTEQKSDRTAETHERGMTPVDDLTPGAADVEPGTLARMADDVDPLMAIVKRLAKQYGTLPIEARPVQALLAFEAAHYGAPSFERHAYENTSQGEIPAGTMLQGEALEAWIFNQTRIMHDLPPVGVRRFRDLKQYGQKLVLGELPHPQKRRKQANIQRR